MLIPFLQALYRPGSLLPVSEDRLKQVLIEVNTFGIQSQVYSLLKESDRFSGMPDFFQEALQDSYDKTKLQNLLILHAEKGILQALDEQRLEAMTLKGTRFAQRFFGHFAARGTSDIDVLVRPMDLLQSVKCVQQLGFQPVKKIHNHMVLHKRNKLSGRPLVLELHWTLEKRFASDLKEDLFWEQSIPYKPYTRVKELSLQHTFYYMCLHGIRHRMDSMKYLLDLAHLLYRFTDEIDYSQLLEQAGSDRNVRRVQTALSIVYQVFPDLHQIKPLPFPEISTHWDYDGLVAHQKGTGSLSYRYRWFCKFMIFDTWKHRLFSQKQLYTILANNRSIS